MSASWSARRGLERLACWSVCVDDMYLVESPPGTDLMFFLKNGEPCYRKGILSIDVHLILWSFVLELVARTKNQTFAGILHSMVLSLEWLEDSSYCILSTAYKRSCNGIQL
jgi:hypothetical protein